MTVEGFAPTVGAPTKRSMNIAARAAALDWPRIKDELNTYGAAVTGQLLTDEECDTLIELYPRPELFRSRVVMQRHSFGQGEYQYFAYPLPPLIAQLREALYAPLADVANTWQAALGLEQRFPADHRRYLEYCHGQGQAKPTPLLLRYVEGDYNRLHQDIYGDQVFPIQATILLSTPGVDFTGGEFVLTEQRPRTQSRVEVVPLRRGEAVLFAVRHRPARGTRGMHRVSLRHGVSRLRSGKRYACGIVFHNAA